MASCFLVVSRLLTCPSQLFLSLKDQGATGCADFCDIDPPSHGSVGTLGWWQSNSVRLCWWPSWLGACAPSWASSSWTEACKRDRALLLSSVSVAAEHYAFLCLQVAFLAGCLYTIVGILKLGWLTNFLSHSVISGFMSGASVIIALSQVHFQRLIQPQSTLSEGPLLPGRIVQVPAFGSCKRSGSQSSVLNVLPMITACAELQMPDIT